MIIKTVTYNNTQLNSSIGSTNSNNTSLSGFYMTSDTISSLPMVTALNGSWGPLTWELDYHIDTDDYTKSYFKIKIYFFGVNIINTTIDENNPEIDIDLEISNVGIVAKLGVDFTARRVYLTGSLNFIIYTTNFDLTIITF